MLLPPLTPEIPVRCHQTLRSIFFCYYLSAWLVRGALLLFNLQDEDSDDMSSDSDDDGGGGGFFGRLKGAKDGEGADEGGSLFGGRLPPKPLGDWDEVVAVPRHSDRDVALSLASRRDGGLGSRDKDGAKGNDIYFIGIIDILQQYNATKRAEASRCCVVAVCVRRGCEKGVGERFLVSSLAVEARPLLEAHDCCMAFLLCTRRSSSPSPTT